MSAMREQLQMLLLGDISLVDSPIADLPQFSGKKIAPGFCLANLETPVHSPGMRPVSKAGPHLKGRLKSLLAIKEHLPETCFSLANNHMMDYGPAGLDATVAACNQLGSSTVGAGLDLGEAWRPAVVRVDGWRIGIIGCCERTFGAATQTRAGVATLDIGIHSRIADLKREVDLVIVSIHGAAEMCPWPSPQWQDLLRSFVDAGARLVHGHHAHVPQGFERYRDGVIFYGLGNYLVEPDLWFHRENTLWSLAPQCVIDNERIGIRMQTVECESEGEAVSVRLSKYEAENAHREYLRECNRPLGDRSLLNGLWQESSVRMFHLFNGPWLGFTPPRPKPASKRLGLRDLPNAFRKWLKRSRRLDDASAREQERLLLRYHLLSCETHQNAIATALGVLCGELEDARTSETKSLTDAMMPWSKEQP